MNISLGSASDMSAGSEPSEQEFIADLTEDEDFSDGASEVFYAGQIAYKEKPPKQITPVIPDIKTLENGETRGPAYRNGYGHTDFMLMMTRYPEKIEYAFKRHNKADLRSRDAMGRTPMFYAACRKKAGTTKVSIKALATFGFSVNARDKYGLTPLMEFLRGLRNTWGGRTDFETTKAFVKNKADMSIRDNSGRTIMHFANNIDTVRLLRSKGRNINEQDYRGESVLHKATAISSNGTFI
jgi:hypothetical protein